MTTVILPTPIENFVVATNNSSADALFRVFADGATVTDNGTSYATADELREWIKVHQIDPRIVITPTSFEQDLLVASVDGEFPGGPLNFAFTFTTQADTIIDLSIELV